VSFSESEKEVITQLTETNRVAEAQAQILGVLERQVGGTARAMADTATGGLTQMTNAFGDLQEALGEKIANDGRPVAQFLTDLFSGWAGGIKVGNEIDQLNKKLKTTGLTAEESLQLANAEFEKILLKMEEMGVEYADLDQNAYIFLKREYENAQLAVEAAEERLQLAKELTLEKELQQRAEDIQNQKATQAAAENREHMNALNAAYEKTKESQEALLRQQIAYFEGFIQGPKAVAVLKMLREELDRISGSGETNKSGSQEKRVSAYEQAINDEKQRVAELNTAWRVYSQIQNEIADLKATGSQALEVQQRLELLRGVSKELEHQLDIENQLQIETAETKDSVAMFVEELKTKLTDIDGIASRLSNSFQTIGQRLAEGESAGESFKDAMKQQLASIGAQISTLAIAAGLRVIVEGGLAGLPIAAALFAIGGIAGLSSGALSSGGSALSISYTKEIVEAEQDLADARIQIIREQLEQERELRNENIRKLQDEFNLEFAVLRDLWQRNLISTSDFVSQTGALNDELNTGVSEEEEAQKEAEDAAALAEALAQAKADKIAELRVKIAEIEKWLKDNHDPPFKIVWPWVRDKKERQIRDLNRRIGTVEDATTVEEVEAAKKGANFITNGPQMLMVGDNPGGKEHVTVEPIPAPINRNLSRGGVTININAPVYGVDDLYMKLNQAGQKLKKRGRVA
jgi:hypothetical protein